MIKTAKSTLVGAVALLVAAVIGFQVLNSSKGEDDNYSFSATWQPVNQTYKTKITVTVDGYPIIVRHPRLSPWSETMTAEKGAKVILEVITSFKEIEKMDCMILRNGVVVTPNGYRVLHGPGMVRCQA